MSDEEALEALDEAILAACIATYENSPSSVVEKQREILRAALQDLRRKDVEQ
jgi:hypothetical protein